MTFRLMLLLPFVVSIVPQDKHIGAAKEPPPLDGEWVCIETADAKGRDRGDDAIRMVIMGNAVTMRFAGLTTNRGTIEVGIQEGMKTIDLRLGENGLARGVYELHRDTLTICVAESGKVRPASVVPAGGQWVERWQRAKSD